MENNRPLRIAVAGLGTVGQGAIDILQKNTALVSARAGRSIDLIAVTSRTKNKVFSVDLSDVTWCETPKTLVEEPDVDVIVEAIGGSEGTAKELIVDALKAGKAVVTANKALLAEHGAELACLASKSGGVLAYEAAVTGGIPAIKVLREGLAANQITAIYGIMNGTCNYIMSEMREKGAAFDAVLKEAQALGYAEADPSFDVDGIDAAHKLALMASLGFGSPIDFKSVHIEGIRGVQAQDALFASQFGYAIKLITSATMVKSVKGDEHLAQAVRPAFVPLRSAVGSVEGVDNAVLIKGEPIGEVFLRGAGAGGGPTGSAIVADLIDLAREIEIPLSGQHADGLKPLAKADAWLDVKNPFYIRLHVLDQAGVLASISHILGEAGISIESMVQSTDGCHIGHAMMAMITHNTTRRCLQPALDAIGEIEQVLKPVQAMDILDI